MPIKGHIYANQVVNTTTHHHTHSHPFNLPFSCPTFIICNDLKNCIFITDENDFLVVVYWSIQEPRKKYACKRCTNNEWMLMYIKGVSFANYEPKCTKEGSCLCIIPFLQTLNSFIIFDQFNILKCWTYNSENLSLMHVETKLLFNSTDLYLKLFCRFSNPIKDVISSNICHLLSLIYFPISFWNLFYGCFMTLHRSGQYLTTNFIIDIILYYFHILLFFIIIS